MQNIFKRYEKKYLVTREQGTVFQKLLYGCMEQDRSGEYLVQNLYLDTESWDVMRTSIEKPLYKEKMRLRCYGLPDTDTDFFIELKKKYKDIVYKRRMAIPATTFYAGALREFLGEKSSQISREFDFYLSSNDVYEKIYISYLRTAYNGIENEGLRVTFDTDVRYRTDGLDFSCPEDGSLILPPNIMIMEIKTLGGIPLWMARALSEYAIYPTAYSKTGMSYKDHIVRPEGCERAVKISA